MSKPKTERDIVARNQKELMRSSQKLELEVGSYWRDMVGQYWLITQMNLTASASVGTPMVVVLYGVPVETPEPYDSPYYPALPPEGRLLLTETGGEYPTQEVEERAGFSSTVIYKGKILKAQPDHGRDGPFDERLTKKYADLSFETAGVMETLLESGKEKDYESDREPGSPG